MALTQVQPGMLASDSQFSGFKNRIINGAMVIDQRNAGAASANTISGYFLDRWQILQSTTGKLIAQQNAGSVTPPLGFNNYLGITSQSAYSVGAGDFYFIVQYIEGFNTADLGFGTANAKTITLSFQVYSSLTGTFGGSLRNATNNRSYPFTYTVSSANTWTPVSVTIAGDTTGTWVGATNGIGLQVIFGLGVGSTYSGTAGAWAGVNYISATGATSVVGTNGATFYITGVQLEKGSTATSFDYRPYGTEENLCLRYFEILISTVYYANSFAVARMDGANSAISVFQNRVIKRASPTYTSSGTGTAYYNSTSKACSGADFAPSGGTGGGRIQWLSLTGGAINTAVHVDTGSGCLLTASAEL